MGEPDRSASFPVENEFARRGRSRCHIHAMNVLYELSEPGVKLVLRFSHLLECPLWILRFPVHEHYLSHRRLLHPGHLFCDAHLSARLLVLAPARPQRLIAHALHTFGLTR